MASFCQSTCKAPAHIPTRTRAHAQYLHCRADDPDDGADAAALTAANKQMEFETSRPWEGFDYDEDGENPRTLDASSESDSESEEAGTRSYGKVPAALPHLHVRHRLNVLEQAEAAWEEEQRRRPTMARLLDKLDKLGESGRGAAERELHHEVDHPAPSKMPAAILLIPTVQQLRKAVDATVRSVEAKQIEQAITKLAQLQRLQVTVDLLSVSGAGMAVRKLKKHENKRISAAAAATIKEWKEQLGKQVGST